MATYIHKDQSGFLQNRHLRDNKRRVQTIIDFAYHKKISAVLYFVDAEKAFDAVEWMKF